MRAERATTGVVVATLVGLVCVAAGLWWVGPDLIEEAYHGRSFRVLNGLVSGQSRLSVEDYVSFFRRSLVGLTVSIVLATAVVSWLRARRRSGDVALSLRVVGLVIALLFLLTAASRVTSFSEPFERDLMAYMVISDGMLGGRPLYADLWDHKPPAIHLTYAAAAAVFGATPTAIWMLGLGAACLTLLGCYVAGSKVGGRPAGLLAAAAWALIGGDLLLQANQPNVEAFLNVCLVWAVVLLLPGDRVQPLTRYALAGSLFFLASLYKPVAVMVPVCLFAAHSLGSTVLAERRERLAALWRTSAGAALAGAICIAGWAVVVAYFQSVGHLAAFNEAVFGFNREYAGSIGANILESLNPLAHPLWATAPYLPAVGIAGVAWICNWRPNRAAWPLAMLIAYLVGAWLAMALPGKLYPHYYQLMLPPIALGVGWLGARILSGGSMLLVAALWLALVGPLAARAYQSVVPSDQIAVFKYGAHGYESQETRAMAPWINEQFGPDAVIYHWGAEPGVYFWSRRSSPVGFVYNIPLYGSSPRAREYSSRVLNALSMRAPDLIVAKKFELNQIDHPVEAWFTARYRPIAGPEGIHRYVFLVPRTSGEDRPDTLASVSASRPNAPRFR